MALESFFYDGELPSSVTLMDMARQALVSCEIKNDLDADLCRKMIDGLCAAWSAAQEYEEGEDDYIESRFDSFKEAERAYHQAFMRAYKTEVRRNYPDYDPNDDGVGWWPDGLKDRAGWPTSFVKALASTLGAVDGAHTVAMWRHFEKRKAAEATNDA
jgi:hypothetical protein